MHQLPQETTKGPNVNLQRRLSLMLEHSYEKADDDASVGSSGAPSTPR